jgi:hypothetical protein
VQQILTGVVQPPKGKKWSTRSMAAAVGVSHHSVHRIWKDGDLKPHVRPTFKISNDPPTTRPTNTKRCATGCNGTRRMVTHFTPTG